VVRQLVEEDQVLLMFGTFGAPPNSAIQDYLNGNKVPQLFITTGADRWLLRGRVSSNSSSE
jgi:branched-chain amino acid transport system substrate-binding protein